MNVGGEETASDVQSQTSTSSRQVLERTTSGGPRKQLLRLMMLGCEDNPPYGPNDHTGSLFLDLICRTLEKDATLSSCSWTVCITIYHVKEMDYPASEEEWDSYDGILLPGSFSSAYETNIEWIDTLCQVVQSKVRLRPTVGICFGHQIYAHSFSHGEATKCPAGPQAGRRVCSLTSEGKCLLPQMEQVELYYTHGDMVERLPPCAVSLGGNGNVPILAAAYFGTEEQAMEFKKGGDRPSRSDGLIAVTFQAHPEYAASPELGLQRTLIRILHEMEDRGDVSSERRSEVEQDAVTQYPLVEEHSLEVMRNVGMLLGWFNEKAI